MIKHLPLLGLIGCGPVTLIDLTDDYALSFAGDGCAHAVATEPLPLRSAITIEAFVRGDPAPSHPTGVIFAFSNQLLLWSSWSQLGWTTGLVQPIEGIVANTTIQDGERHHVAAVWDLYGTSLYVDGQLLASGALEMPRGGSEIHIGCQAGDREGFDGIIDELRISTVARYQNDFEAPTAALGYDEETFALWHFDTGSGPIAFDESERLDARIGGDVEWVAGLVRAEGATAETAAAP